MILVIGEILIDRFPEYERIGGAPFNFAFHLKQMGWPVRFITRIGDDAPGRTILDLLDRHKFDRGDVQIDGHHPTGTVEVALDEQGVPQFDIHGDVAYDHLNLSTLTTRVLNKAKMIYFGTLAQRTTRGHEQYRSLLNKKSAETFGFCDINFRPPHVSAEAVSTSLQHADILKLNTEELERLGVLCDGPEEPYKLLSWLMTSFSISLVALTDGSDGSRAVTATEDVSAAPHRGIDIVDTVGAGDGYAAVLASGVLDRWPLSETLDLATDFAAMICTLPGAVPQEPGPYQQLQQKLRKKD